MSTRVDSPTLSAGADGVHLAFLVREASADGSVGLVGANGVLWTAHLRDGAWQAQALPGADGKPIYAERPILDTQGSESLLLFRRFEQKNDNSRLGQLALSQLSAQANFSSPLYLTDEPRENWLPAMAINPQNGAATILKVARTAAVGAVRPPGNQRQPCPRRHPIHHTEQQWRAGGCHYGCDHSRSGA